MNSQEERAQLMEQKRKDEYSLQDHLASSPIAILAKRGLFLREDHPAKIVKRMKEQN